MSECKFAGRSGYHFRTEKQKHGAGSRLECLMPEWTWVFVKQKPIIAQEIITGERGTDGHVLTVEGRPATTSLHRLPAHLISTFRFRFG
jgi:hypothetical protein